MYHVRGVRTYPEHRRRPKRRSNMGDCGVALAKYSVFIFNLFFGVTGIAIIVIGAIMINSYHKFESFFNESLDTIPVILIIFGVIVLVIAFFGFCGAIRESPCLIMTFAVVMSAILIAEIVLVAVVCLKHDDLKGTLKKGFEHTLTKYEANQDAWNFVQKEVECCGVDGPDDWEKVFNNKTIPESCCQKPENEPNFVCTRPLAHKTGCYEKVYKFLESELMYIAMVGAVIAIIQLLGLGYGCCLYRNFRTNYEAV